MHFSFEPPAMPANAQDLRQEVRAFVRGEIDAGRLEARRSTWTSFDRDFSLRCAERGYIGMTWPRLYGGHERSAIERFIVCEELLALNAPVGSHWIADRQSGPQILRNGGEALRKEILPKIAAGACTFAIGMSEPDAGSDLASIRTRGEPTAGGWRLSGRKVWTTNAHHADYMIVLCRTAPSEENRHDGLTQVVVDMSGAGVEVRPIRTLNGVNELNEVVLEDCFVPDGHVLGRPGEGWRILVEELAFERSGPDRFLSTFGLLCSLVDAIGAEPESRHAVELGRLTTRLSAVRQLSLGIAGMLENGVSPKVEAAITKELGTTLEQDIPDVARQLLDVVPDRDGDLLAASLADAILSAPSFSLRGGTREILQGIIARELGLR